MGDGPTGGLLDKFNLWTEVPTLGTTKNKKQAILFVAVVAGAFSKILYDYLTVPESDIGPIVFVVALIGSIVTFPWIHSTLKKGELTLVKWCLAFQYGFFWPFAMNAVRAAFES